jgi:hypothetical protein
MTTQRKIEIKINVCRALERKIPVLSDLYKRKRTYPAVFDAPEVLFTTSIPLCKEVQARRFFVVDGKWMNQWRKYHAKFEDSERPAKQELLTKSNSLCQHDKTLVPTEFVNITSGVIPRESSKELVHVSNLFMSRYDGVNSAELVSEDQWKQLAAFDMEQAYRAANQKLSGGLVVDETLTVDDCTYSGPCLSWNTETERWQWTPEVCKECQCELLAKASKSVFENVQVSARVFNDESKLVAVGERRASPSKNDYQSFILTLSSTDTVAGVKQKLSALVNHRTGDTFQIFSPNVEMTAPTLTLEQYNFKACNMLNVVVIGDNAPVIRRSRTTVKK